MHIHPQPPCLDNFEFSNYHFVLQFEERRKQNYENFLKERAAEKTEKTWCEFEESEQSNKSKIANSKISKKKNRHNLSTESSVNAKKTNSDDDIDENDEEIDKWINENADEETDGKFANLTSQLDNILKTKPKNKNDKTKNKTNSESSFTITNVDKSDESNLSKKKKKRKRDEASVDNDEANCADVLEKIKKTDDARDVSENKNKINKNKSKTMILDNLEKIVEDISANNEESKPNNKKNKKNKKSNNIDENPKIDESKQEIASDIPKIKKDKKNKQNKAMNPIDFNQKNESKAGEKSKNKFNTPNNKNNKNSEIKRRKPEIEKSILIVNGEELEVSNFDGFPILTKDAERLQDLRKNLISKGIPRSEVMRTMKLERRRAEKVLSRMKKKLCFHCRKGGHNLSECPELAQKNDMGAPSSGICFKCGSTEHTHFACKVVRTQDFKFAQCFICKEQVYFQAIILL